MPLYEHVFIARQDISPVQVESLTEQLQNIIKENGGNIAKHEYWGLRNMQYKIKKNRKGHYSLMNIDAPAAAIIELERQMKINEDILRFMTLRVEEHDSEPSPVVARRGGDRDDRGDRGDRGDRHRGDRDRGDRDRGDRGDRNRDRD